NQPQYAPKHREVLSDKPRNFLETSVLDSSRDPFGDRRRAPRRNRARLRINSREKGCIKLKSKIKSIPGAWGAALLSSVILLQAQEPPAEQLGQTAVEHPECSFFVQRDKFQAIGRNAVKSSQLSSLTQHVTRMLSSAPDRAAI